MITKILVGLSICVGLIAAFIIVLQLLGFIYIVSINSFSTLWVLDNDFENRMCYGAKMLLVLIFIAFILFICFMIGSQII